MELSKEDKDFIMISENLLNSITLSIKNAEEQLEEAKKSGSKEEITNKTSNLEELRSNSIQILFTTMIKINQFSKLN